MAEAVSTILEYLRQHHFLQAEAALKAELAGRGDASSGLFDLAVQENVEKLAVITQKDLKPEVLVDIPSKPADAENQLFELKCAFSEQQNVVDYQLEEKKEAAATAGAAIMGGYEKENVKSEEGTETTKKGSWEQEELLWVSKQNCLQGKIHPLDEVAADRNVQKAKLTAPNPTKSFRNIAKDEDQCDKLVGGEVTPDINLQLGFERRENSKGGILQKYLPKQEAESPLKPEEEAATFEKWNLHPEQKSEQTAERGEGLPRLPPVRLKSVETIPDEWIVRHDREDEEESRALTTLGSFLDVPVGQDISSSAFVCSGTKRSGGSNRPSVSHGIVEDSADILTSFATVADDYPDDYVWDSDDYEDDDDPGYTRRPIQDEATFLVNEIKYPNEEERAKVINAVKYDDDDRSFVESYFSGEEYYKTREDSGNKLQADKNASGKDYDGQLLDSEELKQIRAEPTWQGFVVQGTAVTNNQAQEDAGAPELDPDDFSRDIRETYLAESSGEGDCDIRQPNCYDLERGYGGNQDIVLQYYSRPWVPKAEGNGLPFNAADLQLERSGSLGVRLPDEQLGAFQFGGFSFQSPSSGGDIEGPSREESGRSLWSARDITSRGDEAEHLPNGFVGPDDTLASWKRKSNESSPIISPGEENDLHLALSTRSSVSPHSSDDCLSVEERADEEDAEAHREEAEAVTAYDEEAIAVHEHFQWLQAEEEEFETFELKIIHRKSRTGFEEEKDFPVVLNSVIAGRYHVTEHLGSAAFSKAIQAHDLHTGMDVCMKIIKNSKDFFDQSLDEIKLLKYINKHDPADKYHILRLYDYFYHREHLFIVCELLRANLYEFHKYNRDSGGEVYFTMPRLQSIARQCLEALEFLHGLGLIHCDLKPENILVKSYNRCEVKVIDLGSSCFQSDHLCAYVQSRAYRAPEVILGLPYDQKIDVWSLGCILAELCSGNVLFQSDSLATLLARVVGIIGPLDTEMVAKGTESYKFLTKSNVLYDKNQETQRLEYLIPKKTTLAHRLPMGDQGFLEFVQYLLQINPKKRPTATEALKHPWLSYPYEPISS